MIEYKTGDILSEDVQALVNTVNCVGIMGRGVALQFKNAYPDNFKVYAAACRRGDVQPGHMLVVETGRLTNPRFIINFPTKRHWRGKSRIADITAGLDDLVRIIRDREIRSIALPPLGSGLGGLDWGEVRTHIDEALRHVPGVRVVVFEPSDPPDRQGVTTRGATPSMTPGRAALILLMYRYLSALLDPLVTLLEVHKLMYFMQEAGEPLNLSYVKAPYGPYAENLRHVLRTVEGHYTSGYADGGDAPEKQIELLPGAVGDAEGFLAGSADSRERVNRVVRLVEGFETPVGLELLATIHWIVKKGMGRTLDEVVDQTYRWNSRKQRFSRDQIGMALNVLREQGWLDDAA